MSRSSAGSDAHAAKRPRSRRSRSKPHPPSVARWSFRVSPELYRRPVPKLALAAAILWVGWRVVAGTAADNLADTDPKAALKWSSNHPAALVNLADDEVSASAGDNQGAPPGTELDAQEVTDSAATVIANPDLVADLANRALRADPLETDSLRLLALVADAKGDTSRARSLMELAAQYSKRDVRVQSWLLNQRLLDGDLDGALKSADFMLRTWPEARSIAEPLLVALSSDPDAVKPVVALLQTNPPWRSWFVTTFPGQVEDPAPLETFFKDLKAGPAPPSKDEVNAYLKRLLDLGEFQTAYAARVDFSSPGWVETLGQVNNGGFEQPVDGLPFGWLFANVRGTDTEVVSESASNRALRIQFHNTRVPYRHVSQVLLLRPGALQSVWKGKSRGTQERSRPAVDDFLLLGRQGEAWRNGTFQRFNSLERILRRVRGSRRERLRGPTSAA